LTDKDEERTTPMDTPTSGNVLDDAKPSPGTTVTVTSFSVQGLPNVYTPGTPVTLRHPVTNVTTGTLLLSPSGNYTFTPAPGYVGPAPAVTYTVRSSDGQTDVSALNIDVLPGGSACACKPCMH
jgi:hypothetical protein